MCTYCGTTKYRKIYENHHGPILKEENGRAYEVHHIDGNHSNNDPANLTLVTIQEHYNIHYAQGDWGACSAMSLRMTIPPDELFQLNSKLSKLTTQERIANGTHNFLGDNNPARRKVKDGTYHMLADDNPSKQRVENKTHNFLGRNNPSHDRIKKGTHNWQIALKNGTHPSHVVWCCPHCSKQGKGRSQYVRWHGDNCKLRS